MNPRVLVPQAIAIIGVLATALCTQPAQTDQEAKIWGDPVDGLQLSLYVDSRQAIKDGIPPVWLAMRNVGSNEGYRWKKKLFSEQGRGQLEKLPLATWASRRRQDLLELLDRMTPSIEALSRSVEQEAKKRPEVLRLMTHPGVGPLTALAFVLIIGVPERFKCGKQIGSYIGLIPEEDSSAGHQRLGHITKQGSSLLRFLLVEAAQAAVRVHPDWRRRYIHLAMRRHKGIAKVAMGRRLAIRLYWMWRNGCEYSPSLEFGSYAGQLVPGHGVN